MENKFIAVAVGLTVGVILLSGFLWPIVSDATATEKTFDNTAYGFYQMREIETGDSWVRDGTTWTLNGDEVTSLSSDAVSVITTDNVVFRQNGQIRGTTYASNNFTSGTAVDHDGTPAIQIGSNYIDYSVGYTAVDEGTHILKTYTDKAYVNGDTPLWVTGVTGFPNQPSDANVIVHIEGTIDDGLTVTATKVSNGATSNIEVGEYTINYNEVAGYEDLYQITSVVFDITADYTDSDVTTSINTTATYSTFVLPKEVTAEKSWHLDTTQIALVAAIGTLGAIVLIAAAAGSIRRLD